jgi:hypothetical protein
MLRPRHSVRERAPGTRRGDRVVCGAVHQSRHSLQPSESWRCIGCPHRTELLARRGWLIGKVVPKQVAQPRDLGARLRSCVVLRWQQQPEDHALAHPSCADPRPQRDPDHPGRERGRGATVRKRAKQRQAPHSFGDVQGETHGDQSAQGVAHQVRCVPPLGVEQRQGVLAAICATVMAAPAGWLRPIPRPSNDRHEYRADSSSVCGRQSFPWTPTPWISRTGGPIPRTSYAIGQPRCAITRPMLEGRRVRGGIPLRC